MRKILSQVLAATAGLWLSKSVVPKIQIALYPDSSFFGISLTSEWHIILLLGIILGLLNHYIKPVLDTILLPLQIATLGIFNFISTMALLWTVDAIFKEFSAPWLWPLLYASIIIWALSIISSKLLARNEY
ncbi:MAG: hypothetical protein A3A98_00725 [Candidatus Staskawiczbacteria bacterium RIFCSPLOWO2_01_FULL_40_39]|uniref:Phage holin family protein n=1 Tax=Candidatus Staskawiczbacteria bacterium RIFCSPHIGHO2_01_FULL_39_25 TaxID=1802202 RepID=A0A1G2HN31_9BACT|nr:MAG: hypothetical protein A2730_00725 [Candidatus Staskawiczbacteria bacterium RIFCSPHIGHO2_01_FULL_39_25]OGZ73257.1 MAG: hypothetical protein A3A98_00725 [Candidatus Staskawiczbacteria bacterium RIFCSPLOWO2_01_FULL_40_39]